MSSRMSKYYEEDTEMPTRYHRNENLYKEINKNEIDNFEIKSNSTLLGENKNEIDVEKVKKILDTKYNETAKRRSIRLEEEKEHEEEEIVDTKEYDINVVLEKAKEQKDENYEEERLKKIRNTQFDILKNLKVDEPSYEDDIIDDEDDTTSTDSGLMEKDSIEEENLKTLINTIAINEHKNREYNTSLDILSDLKGSDNTEVLEGLKEEIDLEEEKEYTKEEKTSDMTNSFYTSSNALKKKDFEEIDDDFKDTVEVNGIFLKIVIVIIVLIFLVGIGLLIKSLYFS